MHVRFLWLLVGIVVPLSAADGAARARMPCPHRKQLESTEHELKKVQMQLEIAELTCQIEVLKKRMLKRRLKEKEERIGDLSIYLEKYKKLKVENRQLREDKRQVVDGDHEVGDAQSRAARSNAAQ